MPPPVEDLSDDEYESGDIPFSNAPNAKDEVDELDMEEGDDEEDEEGVFVVEKIIGHQFLDNGSLVLLVKWKGYEKPEDQTWEPEVGLKEGANDILTEYYKTIGGRPKKPAAKPTSKAGPGRKRKLMADSKSESPAAAVAEPKKPRKSTTEAPKQEEEDVDSPNWVPKGKSWEDKVDSVDTIIRDPKTGGLFAFLLWTNGKRSRVSIETCYEKCPLKMLKFYEQHLVFKDG